MEPTFKSLRNSYVIVLPTNTVTTFQRVQIWNLHLSKLGNHSFLNIFSVLRFHLSHSPSFLLALDSFIYLSLLPVLLSLIFRLSRWLWSISFPPCNTVHLYSYIYRCNMQILIVVKNDRRHCQPCKIQAETCSDLPMLEKDRRNSRRSRRGQVDSYL